MKSLFVEIGLGVILLGCSVNSAPPFFDANVSDGPQISFSDGGKVFEVLLTEPVEPIAENGKGPMLGIALGFGGNPLYEIDFEFESSDEDIAGFEILDGKIMQLVGRAAGSIDITATGGGGVGMIRSFLIVEKKQDDFVKITGNFVVINEDEELLEGIEITRLQGNLAEVVESDVNGSFDTLPSAPGGSFVTFKFASKTTTVDPYLTTYVSHWTGLEDGPLSKNYPLDEIKFYVKKTQNIAGEAQPCGTVLDEEKSLVWIIPPSKLEGWELFISSQNSKVFYIKDAVLNCEATSTAAGPASAYFANVDSGYHWVWARLKITEGALLRHQIIYVPKGNSFIMGGCWTD